MSVFAFWFGVFVHVLGLGFFGSFFIQEFCKLNIQTNKSTWNGNSFTLQHVKIWVVFLNFYQLCQSVTLATRDRKIVIWVFSFS